MHETDIPCSECGTDLVERTLDARDLGISTDWPESLQVAECPRCDARYYPERAVSRLGTMTTDSQSGGD